MALISNSLGFVFVHIPKTGGDSVVRSLEKKIAPIDIPLGSTPFGQEVKRIWRKEWGLSKHSTLHQIEELIPLAQFKVFSTVRNPFTRTESLFRYFRQHKQHRDYREFELTDFHSFLRCAAFRKGKSLAAPQEKFVRGSDRLPNFRMIDTDLLEEEWADLLDWLEIPGALPRLRRANASHPAPIDWDSETIEIVEQAYAADFDLLGGKVKYPIF